MKSRVSGKGSYNGRHYTTRLGDHSVTPTPHLHLPQVRIGSSSERQGGLLKVMEQEVGRGSIDHTCPWALTHGSCCGKATASLSALAFPARQWVGLL